MENKKKLFHRLAIALLLYTLLVILWGAWVRISHSGDGCGESWPLCHGQVIPTAQATKTWVEFSHRLTSGLFGILILAFVLWGRRIFPAGHPVRKLLYASLFFTITEALLGAKLVLSGLVGQDDSVHRLVVMSLHQLNSLLLTGSVALVMLFSSVGILTLSSASVGQIAALPRKPRPWILMAAFIVIAVTGGFAALSTTLFPSSSLMEGITQDFSANAHYLLRLRVSHPILATIIGGALALFFWLRAQSHDNRLLRLVNLQTAIVFVVGILFGYMTLFSLAPVWMKIVHLLFAHSLWIALLRWSTVERLAKR